MCQLFFPRCPPSTWMKAEGGRPGRGRGPRQLKEAAVSAPRGLGWAARCSGHVVAAHSHPGPDGPRDAAVACCGHQPVSTSSFLAHVLG